jgi:acetoacetyl-CoA reductase
LIVRCAAATKALALENAKGGITVNVICPGYINTEMVQAVPKDVLERAVLPQIPVNRLGEPEEIARAAVFLAADEAGFVTGSTVSINGGQFMIRCHVGGRSIGSLTQLNARWVGAYYSQ